MNQIESKRLAVRNKQDEIREAARSRMADMLRETRGVEPPAKKEAEQRASQASQALNEAKAAKEAAPSADIALQNQLADQVAKTSREAALAVEEVKRIRAEADAQVKKADDLAKLAKENPVKFLEATGLDLDSWHARLQNGGEETKEERIRREANARIDALEKKLAEKEEREAQSRQASVQQRALEGLETPLANDYPLVHSLVGVNGAYQYLASEAQKLSPGEQADFSAMLERLEGELAAKQQAVLQNKTIAAKYKWSALTPQAETADSSSPRTMTNRVVSSTAVDSDRPPIPGSREDMLLKRARAREILASLRN